MPIYAYICDACGFTKDVLQKVSDTPLTECLSCGKSSFRKKVTAAGFQLKGTGWYATDFRGGTTSTANSEKSDSGSSGTGESSKSNDSSSSESPTTGGKEASPPAS